MHTDFPSLILFNTSTRFIKYSKSFRHAVSAHNQCEVKHTHKATDWNGLQRAEPKLFVVMLVEEPFDFSAALPHSIDDTQADAERGNSILTSPTWPSREERQVIVHLAAKWWKHHRSRLHITASGTIQNQA